MGGGLCPADVNLDDVLDLGDIQGFVTSFIDQSGPADQNSDGVFDLADVQAFIEGFNTGCGF